VQAPEVASALARSRRVLAEKTRRHQPAGSLPLHPPLRTCCTRMPSRANAATVSNLSPAARCASTAGTMTASVSCVCSRCIQIRPCRLLQLQLTSTIASWEKADGRTILRTSRLLQQQQLLCSRSTQLPPPSFSQQTQQSQPRAPMSPTQTSRSEKRHCSSGPYLCAACTAHRHVLAASCSRWASVHVLSLSLSLSASQVNTALEVRSLQLSLTQFAHRFDVSGNGQTALLTLLGDFLRRCGVLHNEQSAAHIPTVPLRAWQNRSDRLRTTLLSSDDLPNGQLDGLRFYAMCPDPSCGKLHALDPLTRHLPSGATLRCDRKLISERTEWPLDSVYHGTPRPRWEALRDTNGQPEPVCGRPLTLSYNPALPADSLDQPREPITVFTYRELRAGVRSLLMREGVQERCEQWRDRAAAAPPAPPAVGPVDGVAPMDLGPDEPAEEKHADPLPAAAAEMSDVFDGQLWRDMHYWPPLERQHQSVPGWWDPHWQQRRGGAPLPDAPAAAAAAGAADAEASSYASSYDGRLLAAPGTIALQLFVDWYQKHKQGHHSVGLIWACVLNLPREERYELHNMMLVGLLPGPRSTSRQQLQGVLQVVRDELIGLFHHPLQLRGRSHRVYLHMLVGDLQAVRPAMGFLTATANYGCTMCDANFSRPNHGQQQETAEQGKEASASQDPPAHVARGQAAPAAAAAAGEGEQAKPPKKSSHKDYRLSAVDPLTQRAQQDADHLRHARVWVNCPDLPALPRQRERGARAPGVEEQRRSAHAYEAAIAADGKLLHVSSFWQSLVPRWRSSLAGGPPFHAEYIEQSLKNQVSFRSRTVCCWSALRDLPYFDTVRASPIDVMHNMLLGVCKQIMRIATGHKLDQAAAAAAAAKQAGDDGSGAHAHASSADDAYAAVAASGLFGAGGVAFGKHELHELQLFMDRSVPPRDVGRIRERLESLDHMKAVEWLNWVTMQAVPAVRALVYQRAVTDATHSKKLGVHGMHLRVFVLLQHLVEQLCMYTTSEATICSIDAQLRDLMQTCADTFHAMGHSVCTPNMHLALHLPQQLRDFGPVQGWWCFPYERLMGVASKLPSKPGTGSVDVARRLLAMLHLAHASHKQQQQEAAVSAAIVSPIFAFGCDHTPLPAPAGSGFAHAYSRSASNSSLRHLFCFSADAAGVAAAAALRGWRSGELAVEGWEPFPGALFNSGSTLKSTSTSSSAPAAPAFANGRVALLQLVRTRCMLSRDFDTSVLQRASGWPRLRADQRSASRGLVSLHHLHKCLLAFHLKAHRSEVQQHYLREITRVQAELQTQQEAAQLAASAAAGPAPRTYQAARAHAARIDAAVAAAMKPFQQAMRRLEEEWHELALALQPEDADSTWERLRPIVEHMLLLQTHSDGRPQPAQRGKKGHRGGCDGNRWSTALAWYEQQVDPAHAGALIDIFDKLLYCGEEIASDIASSRTGVNSYIFVVQPSSRWYGRVSYYVRHRFKGRCYHFAAARWYSCASDKELDTLWPGGYATVHAEAPATDYSPAAAARAAEHELRAGVCSSTFVRWPVLRWEYSPSTLTDLIPVHRIGGRWMPSLAHTATHEPGTAAPALMQYACPLRARVHQGS